MSAGTLSENVEVVIDYIMKKCLWQFHSRAWDRERQNEGIMTQTMRFSAVSSPISNHPKTAATGLTPS